MGTSKRQSLRTALLVAAALGVYPLAAAAQTSSQTGDQNERFGQMKTPEGQQQAGESTGARMSGGGSDGSMAWRRQNWDDMSADDESDMDSHRQSVSHDGHGWDRGGDRWHSWSRDDRDGDGRGDMRGEMQDRMRERMQGRGMGEPGMSDTGRGMGMSGMGMSGTGMGMGAMMGMRPPVGAFFNVQVGDARVTVRCALREQTSACVDAAVSLVNRLRQGASSPGSASPSTSSGAANPAPAPSTAKPTTP